MPDFKDLEDYPGLRIWYEADGRSKLSLERLVDRWERFVQEVTSGYGSTMYEYLNDLTTRENLEVIMVQFPDLRPRLAEILKPLDDKFMAATEVDDEFGKIKEGSRFEGSFRIPKKLVDEFKEDVESLHAAAHSTHPNSTISDDVRFLRRVFGPKTT